MPGGIVRRLGIATLVVALIGVGALASPGATAAPATAGHPLDCTSWRYSAADEPASLPAEFDRDNYKRTSLRDPGLATSPHHLCGQKGAAVDLAWGITRGRPDVRIAVLDSGIKWRDAGAMRDLADRAYLNRGEVTPPCATPSGDCNGDGRFSIADFGTIADRNGNGVADPEDLILDPRYSNGQDDDHNGYVDDISGWDFLFGDNDPLDTVNYGHGTGEAEDSTAADNGVGDVGTCPQCTFIPVRVGDSFIADAARFGAGVLFGLDSGAAVIQEALGAINNPRQAQLAIDAAYRRGVPGDRVDGRRGVEAPQPAGVAGAHAHGQLRHHHRRAEELPRAERVHQLRRTHVPVDPVRLLLVGGHGDHERRRRPRDQRGTRPRHHPVDERDPPAGARQRRRHRLLHAERGRRRERLPHRRDRPVPEPRRVGRHPRVRAAQRLRARAGGARRPHPARGRSHRARAGSRSCPRAARSTCAATWPRPRATSYSYRVEWAAGVQPPAYPAADEWHVVRTKQHRTGPTDGHLATLDLATVAAALGGATGPPADATTGRTDEERFSVRVRVVVTAEGGATDGLVGESQKQVFVHDDPDLVRGAPLAVEGAGTSSPVFADLEPGGGQEMVLATDDGRIHVLRANFTEAPGFPVRTRPVSWWVDGATAQADRIGAARGAIGVGAPVIADLDGDGSPDLAVGDLEGRVSAWDRRGRELPAFDHDRVHTNPAFSQDSPATQDSTNRTKRGFAGSLVAADLDGDGHPELIGAALDRHVYAWHGDGTPVAGFPVLVVDPRKVQSVDPVSHKVTFAAGSGVGDGGELVTTPAVSNLAGDRRPEIVVGAQEEYDEPLNAPEFGGIPGTSGNSREYVISPDGTLAHNPNPNPAQPDGQAYLPGWPVKVGMFQREVLPVIGDGVSAQAAIGDLVPTHPGKEIAVASSVGPLYVFGADGKSALGQVGGLDVPMHWFGGLFANDPTGTGFLRNSERHRRDARRVRRPGRREAGEHRPRRRRRARLRPVPPARHRDPRAPAAVRRPARRLGPGDRRACTRRTRGRRPTSRSS